VYAEVTLTIDTHRFPGGGAYCGAIWLMNVVRHGQQMCLSFESSISDEKAVDGLSSVVADAKV